MVNWEGYIQRTSEKPPKKELAEAVEFLQHKDEALDVGAGALVDTKYLLGQGFGHVTAIDADPAFERLAHEISSENFSFQRVSFQEFAFIPDTYDLVNAQRSLPFVSPSDFSDVLGRIKQSLKVGGIFCVCIFGDRNTLPTALTQITKEECVEMFSDMDMVEFKETEEDKDSVMGTPTHFHEFRIIARKR